MCPSFEKVIPSRTCLKCNWLAHYHIIVSVLLVSGVLMIQTLLIVWHNEGNRLVVLCVLFPIIDCYLKRLRAIFLSYIGSSVQSIIVCVCARVQTEKNARCTSGHVTANIISTYVLVVVVVVLLVSDGLTGWCVRWIHVNAHTTSVRNESERFFRIRWCHGSSVVAAGATVRRGRGSFPRHVERRYTGNTRVCVVSEGRYVRGVDSALREKTIIHRSATNGQGNSDVGMFQRYKSHQVCTNWTFDNDAAATCCTIKSHFPTAAKWTQAVINGLMRFGGG